MTIATTIILGFLFSSDPTFVVPDLCDVVSIPRGVDRGIAARANTPDILNPLGVECLQVEMIGHYHASQTGSSVVIMTVAAG